MRRLSCDLKDVRQVGRRCDGVDPVKSFIRMDGGDFLALISEMVSWRSEGTTQVTKIKGHATEDMVRFGQAREDDLFGNVMADEAADLGRLTFWLLMPGGTSLASVTSGIWSCCCFIDFALLFCWYRGQS